MFRLTTKVLRMTQLHRFPAALAEATAAAVKASGMTQRQVSEETGIPLVTLNRKLTGRVPLNSLELAMIAEAVGTTPTDLTLRAERSIPLAPAPAA